MLFQIWSATDKIFCHFGPFFDLLPPNNPKHQNFEKLKKDPGDIIILHKCTKNHDLMLYCSLDRHVMDVIIFHFGLIKNQNLEKVKETPGDISILQ